MGQILGLDLGTNSIGWAVVDNAAQKIIALGSRIIPMSADVLADYEKGTLETQMAKRRGFRGTRRLYERSKLRRERLHRVLRILGFLPVQYQQQIDFEKHPGKFKDNGVPLIAYRKDAYGKLQFAFISSFNEMIEDFAKHQPSLVADGKLIPHDWCLYYLRQKALTKPVSKEELAWIILNFNTKRGYYQRMEEESDNSKQEVFKRLKVVDVVDNGINKRRKDQHDYVIEFEEGVKKTITSRYVPYGVGDELNLIVSYKLDKEGNRRTDVEPSTRIVNNEKDWTLLKTKTEADLEASSLTVGAYIYQHILNIPSDKIRGSFVRTIERKFYKDELVRILNKQAEFHEELRDSALYKKCVNDLYHQNEAHRASLEGKSFTDLIVDDIMFYQRPLKSKKYLISDCPLESYTYIDKETGEIKPKSVKCITKSNPIFQEFRLWQFVRNLKIYAKQREVNGKLRLDYDCTSEFIKSEDDVASLFEWLNEKKEIDQTQFLKYPGFGIKKTELDNYRWNYVEDKKYPCNETRYLIMSRLKKVDKALTLTTDEFYKLWHILYSVDDRIQLDKALCSFARSIAADEDEFCSQFRSTPPFKAEYGSYSQKAIAKLLPLMRCGKFWDEAAIDASVKERIDSIVAVDIENQKIMERVNERLISLSRISDFRYMELWLALYVVYGDKADVREDRRWTTPDDIDYYLRFNLKQGTMRNPIVEQVVTETLRVVRDIWKAYGSIDEVHIELGREMKQTKDQRLKTLARITDNENTNIRIRALLQEFTDPSYGVKDVRPYSPMHQEKLKIYEEAVLDAVEADDEIKDILKGFRETDASKRPSHKQVERYKLWLEQHYCSPYTGQPIPLSRLFTEDYQIEHIIPKTRYYDDSLSNKVICESEVNQLKSNMLGYEFIREKGGQIISNGLKILNINQYEAFIKENYSRNKAKMNNLLLEDVPESFINRQMNDSRYISREIMHILSNLVRNEKDDDEPVSKNVIPLNGKVTTVLKKDWGLNDVWNQIVYPRFERLNRITESHDYGEWRMVGGKKVFQTSVPLAISKGFQKKRIDHRHHAMDALTIALTTRNHINFLNNVYSGSEGIKNREALKRVLCDKQNGEWLFKKPWESFTQEAFTALSGIIVSFKQNLRVINKMNNHYQKYVDGRKQYVKQTAGDSWAIRKSLHKASVSAAVNLKLVKSVRLADALKNDWKLICDKEIKKAIKELVKQYGGRFDAKVITKYFKDRDFKLNGKDISKVEVFYYSDEKEPLSARRELLDTSYDEKKIMSITDTGIQRILLNHLHKYDDEKGKAHPENAFSPEGIMEMNKNIQELNGGKPHKPIYSVRKTESKGMKFSVGSSINNICKYVEADKGTNLYFAIYIDNDGLRSYESIPFNIVVERLKRGLPAAEEVKEDGRKLLFTLSPNDLVYVKEDDSKINENDNLDNGSVYKMISSSDRDCFFVPAFVASPIVKTIELGSNNKSERSWNGLQIKKVCCKLYVDRLGRVYKIIQ